MGRRKLAIRHSQYKSFVANYKRVHLNPYESLQTSVTLVIPMQCDSDKMHIKLTTILIPQYVCI